MFIAVWISIMNHQFYFVCQQQKPVFNMNQSLPSGYPPINPVNVISNSLEKPALTGKSHLEATSGYKIDPTRPNSSLSDRSSAAGSAFGKLESNSDPQKMDFPSSSSTNLEDWNCVKCQTANFSFRQVCKICGAAKKVEAAFQTQIVEKPKSIPGKVVS